MMMMMMMMMNCFCGIADRGKASEILTIANLQHATSKIWTSAEPEFRVCWIKLCSCDNHYTTCHEWAYGIIELKSGWIEFFSNFILIKTYSIDAPPPYFRIFWGKSNSIVNHFASLYLELYISKTKTSKVKC